MTDYQHWKTESDDDGRLWLGIDKADSGANVLSGAIVRDARVVVQQRCIEPGFAGLFVARAAIAEVMLFENTGVLEQAHGPVDGGNRDLVVES